MDLFIWFDRKSFNIKTTRFHYRIAIRNQKQLHIKTHNHVRISVFTVYKWKWIWKIAIRSNETWPLLIQSHGSHRSHAHTDTHIAASLTIDALLVQRTIHSTQYTLHSQRIWQIYHHISLFISGHNSRSKLNNIHNMLIVRQNAKCTSKYSH